LLEDADIGALAPPGAAYTWIWRQQDIDLDIRDVELGGTVDRLRIASGDMSGSLRGEPLRLTRLEGRVNRDAQRATARITTAFGVTALDVAASGTRAGAWEVALVADTVHFDELRALPAPLPRTGGGRLDVIFADRPGGFAADIRTLRAAVGA